MHGRLILLFFSSLISSWFSFSLGCLPIVLFATSQQARAQDESGEYGTYARAIEKVLHKQQEAWNKHDLEGFMAGYWNSPELTFFSGAKEYDGWHAAMDRYLAKYGSPGHEMGKLEFSGLRVVVLGQEAAFVRGTWKLTMADGKKPGGLFTLVFRKFPEGWKIVHDHTSAGE
jgi:beta-aspartyl-peptidase (threonine type)